MLALSHLATLERSLHHQPVLSVYLDGSERDPAVRLAQRNQLDRLLEARASALASAPAEEREAFERCRAALQSVLPSTDRPLDAAGWVAFVPASGTPRVCTLPAPVPTVVEWGQALLLAPYATAVAREATTLVVVADSRHATVHRVRSGAVERLDELTADVGEARDGGSSTELAHLQKLATERMITALAGRLEQLAAGVDWLVIGGVPETVRHVLEALPPRLAERATLRDSLHAGSTGLELARAAADGAALLRDDHDTVLASEVRDRAGAEGLGVLGWAATRRALIDRAVYELVLTEAFTRERAAEAEEAVHAALAQGARITVIGAAAADRLTEGGAEGVGALLRFAVYAPPRAA